LNTKYNQFIKPHHLSRKAYLYVRQSTYKQLIDHQESTKRQYALKKKAQDLGWLTESVITIDDDTGTSAKFSGTRAGFQELVYEVSMGNVGIVMGIEVSRLARNNAEWHSLLEMCALSKTLILDEDGIYDPNDVNCRLLLGLKGTMSEMELHTMTRRMLGGLLNKASRGELLIALPAGLVYDDLGLVRLDPDKQVQDTINLYFEYFRQTGSSHRATRKFNEQNLRFPRRIFNGAHKGSLVWVKLSPTAGQNIIKNPRYAGAYAYGRTRTNHLNRGPKIQINPQEQWHTLIKENHPGYISWSEYEENQKRLKGNSPMQQVKSPPREGVALLQGLAVCGICGHRMLVRYRSEKGKSIPIYHCHGHGNQENKYCQFILGREIDETISKHVIKIITPMTLNIALEVQKELQSRFEEIDSIRYKEVERLHYEAELAKNRYMRVDPNNRLVAGTLEADWNEKLTAKEQAQAEYEKQRENAILKINEEQQKQILSITQDFPSLWNNPKTSQQEKKRLLGFLIEDVTITKTDIITLSIRYKGGALETLEINKPLLNSESQKTNPEIIEKIDKLLEQYTDGQIAENLTEQEITTRTGMKFTGKAVRELRIARKLKNRYDRLRESGLLTLEEIGQRVGLDTAKKWATQGLLKKEAYNDSNGFLYHPMDIHEETALVSKQEKL
jgi:DNA invertase Pin-like site-specific DNA recombinase